MNDTEIEAAYDLLIELGESRDRPTTDEKPDDFEDLQNLF